MQSKVGGVSNKVSGFDECRKKLDEVAGVADLKPEVSNSHAPKRRGQIPFRNLCINDFIGTTFGLGYIVLLHSPNQVFNP